MIDGSSRGADGVRLADVNGDGLLDIATGWEEGGITRAYLHPGGARIKDPWPAVTVGGTPSVEDAVFCDLDGDGAVDVVSSCEGRTRRVLVHWAPRVPDLYLSAAGWRTEAFPASIGRTQWMFALPLQIDGQCGPDLVVGARGGNAVVGWLQAPADPRRLDGWRLHGLYRAGWIMSLVAADVDEDGDRDIVVSDRKGPASGVLWLENPGPAKALEEWREHRVGASGREVMFLDVTDLGGDGRMDIVCAVRPSEIHCFQRPEAPTEEWSAQVIPVAHPEGVGTAKAVRVGDVDGDGHADMVYSCGNATPPRRGLLWFRGSEGAPEAGTWPVRDIAGPEGTKFDRIELLDLDGDGDLDVLTCEERHKGRGLGVIWYENPGETQP